MNVKAHLFSAFTSCLILTASALYAGGQSQTSNGQIEGTVIDHAGNAVTAALVTITNRETGARLTAAADESGVFRFLVIPIGPYRLSATAPSFKTIVYDTVTISTGQTVVLDLRLEIGDVHELVTISTDAPVADPGKIELGRVMNNREVQNLPLVSLNPYNFVFLQPNVTGNRTAAPDIGFPNVNANGFSRRGNYMIDGNYATDVTLGGVRMLLLSRTYVNEVQLTTRGMPAEFGWTVGHVTNFVTPSGLNSLRGSASYQFRRPGFAAERFNVAPGSKQPVADIFTASLGGPILHDRWQYYLGFEGLKWDLARAARNITITPANRDALITAGVPASAMPSTYAANDAFVYAIGRTDAELNPSHRLALRFFFTKAKTEKNGASGLNTLQLSRDNVISEASLSAQLISNVGDRWVNELRFQRSVRDSSSSANEHTGVGDVTIRIAQVASFGAPTDAKANFEFRPLTTIQNNTSTFYRFHSIKVGGGLAVHRTFQPSKPSAIYTFSDLQRFFQAFNGANRRSYANYSDTFGDTDTRTKAIFLNAFAQDDWKINRRVRVNVGMRYDLFMLPEADGSATYAPSREFQVDKNNLAPRLGLAYALSDDDRVSVIRASAGLYYDPPILDYYRRAILRDGSPRTFSVSLNSQQGPEFPGRLASASPPTQFIESISPDFKTMTALHANLQYEKALTENLSAGIAYSLSRGWHIPTSRNVNCLPTGRTLADGRPVFGNTSVDSGNVTVTPCTNRIVPEFSGIWSWESSGNLAYHALTLSLMKRFSAGMQFSINYTLARSIDDAPEENIAVAPQLQSDPSNRSRDRSVSISDQRHTFVTTFVGRTRLKLSNRTLNYLVNQNQFALIARASDGERYNIVADSDLNGDGGLMDRPVGIPRNALKTPRFFNLDLRYTRSFRLTEKRRLEFFADIVNLTNTKSIVGFTNTKLSSSNLLTSLVNPLTGELRGPLPDFKAQGVTTDSRRVQLGIKVYF